LSLLWHRFVYDLDICRIEFHFVVFWNLNLNKLVDTKVYNDVLVFSKHHVNQSFSDNFRKSSFDIKWGNIILLMQPQEDIIELSMQLLPRFVIKTCYRIRMKNLILRITYLNLLTARNGRLSISDFIIIIEQRYIQNTCNLIVNHNDRLTFNSSWNINHILYLMKVFLLNLWVPFQLLKWRVVASVKLLLIYSLFI
jgi:hypothetical protein